MNALFPPEFVRGIQRLRWAVRRTTPTPQRGEQISRRAGPGLDFRDYRPYAPGDDWRRIDWNVYRRTRRVMLRVYDTPRRVPLRVLLDASASMFFDAPPRADAGRQAAAALAAAALATHDPVTIYPFAEELARPLRAETGRALPGLLAELARLAPGAVTDLRAAANGLARTSRAQGVLAVVSDFFQPDGLPGALDALARLGQRLILVRVIDPGEAAPQLGEEAELIDCETQQRMRVTVDEPVLARYRAARAAFEETLARFAAQREAVLVTVSTDRPVLRQLAPLLVAGLLRC